MLPAQRRAATHQLIEQGVHGIEELATELAVSLSTVRRDLDALETEGVVRRVHGGAVLARPTAPQDAPESPLGARAHEHSADKQRIAQAAARLIQPGSSVLITGGTTTAGLAPLLPEIGGITVITNSLHLASRLAQADVDLVVLGGALRRPELSLLGPIVGASLAELHVDHALMGVYGIDPRSGLLGASALECETDRRVAHCATRLTILADSSKFSQRSAHRIGALQIASEIVTTSDAPAGDLDAIRAEGVDVVFP